MKVTLAQLNPTVGDSLGNLNKITGILEQERHKSPDLMIFPELFLSGYPPRDLVERSAFIRELKDAVSKIIATSHQYPKTGLLFGVPLPTNKGRGKGLFNAALLIKNGEILAQANKSLLPTYDVFDEARYFEPASDVTTVPFGGEILGISICEDAWNDPELWYRPIYDFDPISRLAAKGATLFINISASPFNIGKDVVRYKLIRNHAQRHGKPFIFVNQVGGNDELIFDGSSFIVDQRGNLLEHFPAFQSFHKTIDLGQKGEPIQFKPLDKIQSMYAALIVGIRDYVTKCGFRNVVLGLSGGIDSAVTCVLAVKALGADHVWGITMPSDYSSQGSLSDSGKLADNLGIRFQTIPIKSVFKEYLADLKDTFRGTTFGIAEENIQARIRGNILMAISNKYGHLVLSTGNKSEMAMGYSTLYGDMSGGLSVISDVPKTMVYELAHYINRKHEVIPQTILDKAPSAELRHNQKDQDTLPPYEILDEILELYLQAGCSASEIIQKGFESATVYDVIKTVDRNEYKRRQSPPGLKVTSKAFGSGRRMPIAAKFTQSWG